MTNREKVIRGLECHSEPHFGLDECFCETCPYDELTCGLDVPADALKLLKAQEPVKAYRLHGEKVIDNGEKVFTGQCTNCFCYLVDGWKACPLCGKAVIWE